MSFAGLEYLPFLFAVVAVFQFLPMRARIGGLVCASALFYGWRDPSHIWILATAALIGFAGGLAIEASSAKQARRMWLTAVVIGELALLILVKNHVSALGLASIGISFYTLQHCGYAIDVYRHEITACRAPIPYALFGSFFPLLHAGPIERASHLTPQFDRLALLSADNFVVGARRILWGLAKKTVLADRLHAAAGGIFADPAAYEGSTVLLASLCMLAVLYADFSAYTDIARGSARLFGIELFENFRRPFVARSVPDFMRRWHMSLVTWTTDYVYSPLFGTRPSHVAVWRANLGAMLVFGLWHGGSWKFVFVGITYGTILSAHQSIRLSRARRKERAAPSKYAWLGAFTGWATTTLLACAFIVFFFADDFAHADEVLGAIAGLREASDRMLTPDTSSIAKLAAMLLGAFAVHASGEIIDWEKVWRRVGGFGRLAYLALLAVAVIFLGVRETSPFLYFQF
jgi:D-alanyl-lipoteichoic acid acyltransferase DltB (MBOAT superfamily)